MNQGSSVGLSIQGFFGGWKHSLGLRICCPAWPICSQPLLALTPGGRFPIDRSIACERFSCRGIQVLLAIPGLVPRFSAASFGMSQKSDGNFSWPCYRERDRYQHLHIGPAGEILGSRTARASDEALL